MAVNTLRGRLLAPPWKTGRHAAGCVELAVRSQWTYPSRILSFVAAGPDLDLRPFRRRRRYGLFFNSADAGRHRPTAPRSRFSPATLVVRRIYPALWRDPLARCADPLGSRIQFGGLSQSRDRSRLHIHCGPAVAPSSFRPHAALAFAIPHGVRGAARERGEALPGAEDGDGRPAHGRRGA